MTLTKVTHVMITGAEANVLDFGADPTGVADSTSAITAAIATGCTVHIPTGIYKCNVDINRKVVLIGDGTQNTILKPYDDTIAVMTYTYTAMHNPVFAFWDYHSEIHSIGFNSNTDKVGVGFTFGKTEPSDYETNDEYANNVHFIACNFVGFDKGVQFPFGNIGSEFYSCGFSSNYYGIYSLDNKFGGTMHAGCKTIYGGEMHSNVCAVYINNATDGYGMFSLHDVVLESNDLCVFSYNSSSPEIVPFTMTNCWSEANGTDAVTVDAWSGTTKTTQSVTGPYYLYGYHHLIEGGFIGGVNCACTDSSVIVRNCRAESESGVGGASFTAAAGSYIYFDSIATYGVDATSNPQLIVGNNFNYYPTDATSTFYANQRGFMAFVVNKTASKAYAGVSSTLETAETLTGSYSLAGTQVSDGLKYTTCNEWTTAPATGSNYLYIPSASMTIPTAGWYVAMIDIKNYAGHADIEVHFSNLSSNQMAVFTAPADSKWHTLCAFAYFPASTAQEMYFRVNGGSSYLWRASAAMFRRMDSKQECIAFLNARCYITP